MDNGHIVVSSGYLTLSLPLTPTITPEMYKLCVGFLHPQDLGDVFPPCSSGKGTNFGAACPLVKIWVGKNNVTRTYTSGIYNKSLSILIGPFLNFLCTTPSLWNVTPHEVIFGAVEGNLYERGGFD